jgi:hypothetical protein
MNASTRELRQAEERWFTSLFCPRLAYVRPTDNGMQWEVRAADGELLGRFTTRETALCAARRGDYDAVTAH